MILTVQIHLRPDLETAARLKGTVQRFNVAANWIAGELFVRQLTNKVEAQKVLYQSVRKQFGLSSQMAILCIHRVCEAHKRDKSIQPVFRELAAITYDVRTMSFKGIDRVSLLTLDGRVIVPFIIGKYQAERFRHARKQADLILKKDGKWFLLVTVDVPDGTPIPATDFLGVDLGIAQLATDSDGNAYSGKAVETVRRKHNLQRKRLQRRNTRGAKKKLKRVSGKETRFRKHENHCISKSIVHTAKRTERGIALEDLTNIRDRVTARGGDARNRLSGWSFGQLGEFIRYKARLDGVPIVTVDPRNTSRTCSSCGHCEKANRKSQAEFFCKACGHKDHADRNAALNIRALGLLSVP